MTNSHIGTISGSLKHSGHVFSDTVLRVLEKANRLPNRIKAIRMGEYIAPTRLHEDFYAHW